MKLLFVRVVQLLSLTGMAIVFYLDSQVTQKKAQEWVGLLGWTPLATSCQSLNMDFRGPERCVVTTRLPDKTTYSVVLGCEHHGCAFWTMTQLPSVSSTDPSKPLP